MPTLIAGEYVLRPPSAQDAPAVLEAIQESTATVGRWMTWATPSYGLADALSWIDASESGRATGTEHEFAILSAKTGGFVGVCGLNQFNRLNNFCNLGYWVRESAQGHGIATAAVLAVRDHAFNVLGLARLEIVVAMGNEASAVVARKVGACFEGRARNRLQLHGLPTDALVYSIVPSDVLRHR